MAEAEEQKPDSGFDRPPPPRLRVLVLAVLGISAVFLMVAIGARLLLQR